MRPILLDLFCCAGGASYGYELAGFAVVGVDIVDQPNYPFDFIQMDALKFDDWSWVDAIHASPPCQQFTAYRRRGQGVGETALNLIPQTRELLRSTGLPYIIENVPGAPLIDPVQLCGTSFGKPVRRHRLFESNQKLTGLPCDHDRFRFRQYPSASRNSKLRRTIEVGVRRIPLDVQRRAMGISWMKLEELSQAIPPYYTEYLGRQLLAGPTLTSTSA